MQKNNKWSGHVLLLMELRLTATECDHMGSQRSHLRTAMQYKWTHPALTPAKQASIQFTYPRVMEGWVDLGDWLQIDDGL